MQSCDVAITNITTKFIFFSLWDRYVGLVLTVAFVLAFARALDLQLMFNFRIFLSAGLSFDNSFRPSLSCRHSVRFDLSFRLISFALASGLVLDLVLAFVLAWSFSLVTCWS